MTKKTRSGEGGSNEDQRPSLRATPGSVTVTGEVVVWEQEGGYCSPQITIGGEELHDLLTELIPGCPDGGGGTGHHVEITIRKIPPNNEERDAEKEAYE